MADRNGRTNGFQSITDILGGKDSAALTTLFEHRNSRDTRDIRSTPQTIAWLNYEAGKAGIIREAVESGDGLSPSQYEQRIYALTQRQDI